MSAIRLDRTAILFALVLTVAAGAPAGAQLVNGKWQLPPAGSGRTAAVPIPPPQAVYGYPAVNPMYYPQPVAVTFIPAVLMSDGTVWANFGYGFEPVVRSCYGVAVGGQQRIVDGSGAVLQHPAYTQPVPNQATASQQMVSGGAARSSATVVSRAAQVACFSRDASGRFFARF